MKKVNVFTIILISFIFYFVAFGAFFLFSGYNISNDYNQGFSKIRPWGSCGVQFGYDSQNVSNVIVEFNLNTMTKVGYIRVLMFCATPNNYSFMITLPYNVTLIEPNLDNWTVKVATSGTLLYTYFNSSSGWRDISVTLNVKDDIALFDHGEYSFYFPLGSGIQTDIQNLIEQIPNKPPIISEGVSFLTLDITIKPYNTIELSSPQINHITYSPEYYPTIEFRLSSLEPILLNYKDPFETSHYQTDLFMMSFSEPLGFSMILAAIPLFIDLLQRQYEKKKIPITLDHELKFDPEYE